MKKLVQMYTFRYNPINLPLPLVCYASVFLLTPAKILIIFFGLKYSAHQVLSIRESTMLCEDLTTQLKYKAEINSNL